MNVNTWSLVNTWSQATPGGGIVIDVESRSSYTRMYEYLLTQGYEGAMNDVLNEWLEDGGYTGAFNDKMFKYLRDLGFSGTLPDMRYSWLKM